MSRTVTEGTKMTTCAVYVRLSQEGDNVDTQERNARRVASERGWEVADIYKDNGHSAWKRNGKRPEFKRLLADMEAGTVRAIIFPKPDRLTRQRREAQPFLDLVVDRQIQVAFVEHHMDLLTSMGQFMFTGMINQAEMESANTSGRIKDEVRPRLAEGRPYGRRVWGYTLGCSEDHPGPVEIVPDEARFLRVAVDAILGGATLRGTTRKINAMGSRTPKWSATDPNSRGGAPWEPTGLRRLLVNPRYQGSAYVPQLITPAEQAQLTGMLRRPDNTAKGGARRHMLSGLTVCGLCGTKLVVRMQSDHKRIYACPPDPRGCGGVSIHQSDADALASEWVMKLGLRKPRVAVVPDVDPEALRVLRERKESMGKALGQGLLTIGQVTAANAEIDAEITAIEAKLATVAAAQAVAVQSSSLHERWATLDIEARRTALQSVLGPITLMPATKGAPRKFDPTRLVFTDAVWGEDIGLAELEAASNRRRA